MSARTSTHVDGVAGPRRVPGPRRKLSVSLPDEVVAYLAARAEERGVGLSTILAEIVEADRLADEQARLNAALELDAEDNLRLAAASAPLAAGVIGTLEW